MKRILLGLLAFVAVIVAAVWLTLKRDDIPIRELERRYATDASRYMELDNGVRAHFLDVGPRKTDVTLIFLHDLGGGSDDWRQWILELENEYRIIAIDLPGHGLTQAPPNYAPSIDSFGDLVGEVVTRLELGDIAIAGSALGARVAYSYSLKRPGRVSSLILVGATGWERSEDEKQALVVSPNDLVAASWLQPIVQRLDMTNVMRESLAASFVDKSLVSEDMVLRYADLSRGPGRRAMLWKMIRDPGETATVAELSQLIAPTLILHGEKDVMAPPRFAKLFHDAIPDSTLILYEGVGHRPHNEIPQRSASDLRNFLAGVHASDPDTLNQALESSPALTTDLETSLAKADADK